MEISDAYRKARRNTSIFCGISLAWSAAQFDLTSLNIGAAGKVDLSRASIPTILACVVIYTIVRCTIEFMMQSNEVRRWNLAQIDYKITLNLVRVSLLTISAATASRSLETVVGVVVAALAFIFSYFVLVLILMLILMPLRMYIRSRQGRISAASSAMEATTWSMLIVGVSYLLLFITLGISGIKKIPYIELLPSIPNQISTIIFATTAILITLSYFFEGLILKKVFAFVPVMIERSYFDENGRKIFSVEPNPEHPEYEKHKHQSPLVYTKVERNEKLDTSAKNSDGGEVTATSDKNEKNI